MTESKAVVSRNTAFESYSLPRRVASRWGSFSLAVLLTFAILLIYWRVAKFEFIVWDDLTYVGDNPRVLSGMNLRNFAWSLTTFHAGYWIPLTWLSFLLDAQISGSHPGGYHVTNLVLHVVNTLLVFVFLAKSTQNQIRSVFVAAFFAIHPLRVESVAWIVERKDVLSTLFGLLSLISYVQSAKTRHRLWLMISFLFFIASLASKPTLVTLPFVFLLLDFWPLQRFVGGREKYFSSVPLVAEKMPFVAASMAFSIITFIAQRSIGAVVSLEGYPFGTRCANALISYATYLRKTLIPNDLAIFYPHPRGDLVWSVAAVAAVLFVTFSVAAVVWARRYPFFMVGWFWYVGTLIPMIGIVQVGRQQMADRFTYFPSIGLYVACIWLAVECVPAGVLRNRLLPAAGIAGLGTLGVISFLQVGYWRDSVTVFRHALECGHDSPLARSFLGSALVARGEASEGLPLLESAVAIEPTDPDLQFNLAVGLQTQGQLDAAASHYLAALALHEQDAGAHFNLGVLFLKRGQYEAAKRNFRRTVEIDPDNVNAYANLGTACLQTGAYAEAIANSQRALDLDPGLIKGHHNLAVALLCQGRLDEAISQFRYLASVLPDDRQTQLNLERALAMKQSSPGR